MPVVHDPSTVIQEGGRYYVFTTGKGAPMLSSPDGVTWTRVGSVFERIPDDVLAGAPGNKGTDIWAPDIIKVDGQFLLYYAVSVWDSFVSAIGLATNTILDTASPAYRWVDRGIVVQSTAGEDLNAIDPGVIRAPDGTLWLSYGSYHGTIQLIELDTKTGLRFHPKIKATVIASKSESSDIIAHDGYFYLFVNHGTCCQGKNSGYNLRVGRSRTITGPYLDKHGRDMAEGGGSLFLPGSEGRIGPGHFGRVLESNSEAAPAERFSLHYEAGEENKDRPTLDIRPLLWSADGWPVAGDHLRPGRYALRSAVSENSLEVRADTPAGQPANGASSPVVSGAPSSASALEVSPPRSLRLADYRARDTQQWTIEPVAGGYSKILNAKTGDALQMTGEGPSLT